MPRQSRLQEDELLIDNSPSDEKVDASELFQALGFKERGSAEGIDVFAVHDALRRMLASRGGSPGVPHDDGQATITSAEDWRKVDLLASVIGEAVAHRPSSTQVADLILHSVLSTHSIEDLRKLIEDAARGEEAEG